MIKNQIKIAWRSIFKRKFHSFINLAGLVCSLAFVLLIGAYIWQTYQVNSSLRHKDRQYALQSSYKEAGMGLDLTTVGALPRALKEEYPHLVANYYRIDGLTCIVSNGTNVHEENVSLGDASLLGMFGFELLGGNVQTALSSPFSVVLKASMAMKYFGRTDVVGQRLTIRNFAGNKHEFTVTGILKPTEANTVMELMPAMRAGVFIPLSNEDFFGRDVDNWANLWIASFVELQEGVRPEQLEEPIHSLLTKHADERVAASLQPLLKPLQTYYLDDNNGAIRQLIRTLGITATFLLLMAVINFVNFTIGQSVSRLKEVGVRTIMGSNKKQLVSQLLTEYTCMVALAGVLALVLYPLLSHLFAGIMAQALPALWDLPLSFFAAFTGGVLLLGLLSGLYPALKLASNPLLASIQNQLANFGGKHHLRRALLFLQFVVAIVVWIASIVISKQVDTFVDGHLGYNKDYLLTVQVPRDWSTQGLSHMEHIRQEFSRLSQVQDISLSYGVPGSLGGGVQQVRKYGAEQPIDALLITSDQFFASTYQIPVVAGHFFTRRRQDRLSDNQVVINKKAALAFGYSEAEQALGQQISLFDNQYIGKIAGITEDFFANSMHTESPAVVWLPVTASNQYRFLSIRLRPGSMHQAITELETHWKRLMPDAPFEIQFMDDTIQQMYTTERQLLRASQTATAVCIFIVALGVIGLTTLALNLRMKEIGIRKVLGASLSDLVQLFGKEFYIVFALALSVSLPLTWILMKDWLMNYAVRMELSGMIFLTPIIGILLLLLSIITIIIIRSTKVNPIRHLRNE
ncbi:ABC transporter permease [Sphingobacterium suaedae]|uniref:ABC transporter permease n=1 Tax=Sphingobacterium suaedae TaxID=1686402 RepID=A0ABW5KK25_9SPHI